MRIWLDQPSGQNDWAQYYQLRWEVLRKPLGLALGSERDERDENGIHVVGRCRGKIIGVGRLHFNSPMEAQIRYMAVDPKYRGRGLGQRILADLEKRARSAGAAQVTLNARKTAAPFYEKLEYKIAGDGPLMFGSVPHVVMIKNF